MISQTEALRIMKATGWGIIKTSEGWQVVESRGGCIAGVCSMILDQNPFVALERTYRWKQECVRS